MLKFYVFLIFSLLPCTMLNAAGPTASGSSQLGLSLQYRNVGGDFYASGGRLNQFTSTGSYGYFLFDGLMLKGNGVFSIIETGPVTFTRYGLGPGLYYFFGGTGPEKVKGKILPYVGIDSILTVGKAANKVLVQTSSGLVSGLSTRKTYNLDLAAKAGLTFMLSEQVGVFLEAGFEMVFFLEANSPYGLNGNAITSNMGLVFFL